MKISELPQPYRDIAEMRREQFKNGDWCKIHEHHFESTNEICYAFMWGATPEDALWLSINRGETPDIPPSSLAELEAWRKAKQEANKPETWGKQLYDSGQFHDLLTKYENAEPDYKELYEQLKDQYEQLDKIHDDTVLKYGNLIDEHYAIKQTPSRNWVAECAMAAMQGLLANPDFMDETATHYRLKDKAVVAKLSFDYAEAWAAEGKKRGHIN